MPQDELLDIYDENLQHLGVKARAAVHRDGDWHRVFQCLVIYRDAEGEDWLLVQRRGPDKDTYPNLLDSTAAGHYAAGESVRDGIREVEEELGIQVSFEQLIPIGMRLAVGRGEGFCDREFGDVFLLVEDRPLQAYAFQTEEVAALIRINISEGLALFSGQRAALTVQALVYDPAADRMQEQSLSITEADFVPTIDRFFYKICVLARRCLDGEPHLLV